MRTSSRIMLPSVLLVLASAGGLYITLRPAREAVVPGAGRSDARALYQMHCAVCHGESGKGDGPGAAITRQRMPDFTNAAAMQQVSDTFLAEIIKKGGSQFGRSNAMPAWGMKLSDAEVEALVRYIRSLANPVTSGPSARP